MIRSILKVEQRSMVNYIKSLSDAKKITYGLLGVVIALFIIPAVISLLSLVIFNSPEGNTGGFILLVSTVAVIILTLIAVNSIIKEMFMDRNIQLYLTFPISPSSLFMAKFLKQWLLNTVVIMLPLGLIFGVMFSIKEDNWFLIVTHLFYFFLLSMVVITLAYGLVFLVTKVLPANKVGEVLAFLGGISFILVYAVLLIGSASIDDVLDMIPKMDFLYSGFLYNFNLGRGIIGAAVSLVIASLLTIGLRSFIVLAFKSGWVGEHDTKREKKNASTVISTSVKMLMLKDFRLTFRDFKEWAVLLPQYLLPAVMVFLMYSNPAGAVQSAGVSIYDAQMIAVSISGTIIISLYVGAYNTARDAGHFEFLKILPIKAEDVIKAKYLYNILTITPVYILVALIAWLTLPVSMTALLYSVLFIIFASLAMIPVGMFAGSANPVVSTKNPTRRLDTGTNVILSIVMAVFLLTAAVFSMVFISSTGDINHMLANIVLVILIAATVFSMWSLKFTKKRYDKGFNITYKD